jgi:predicted nuclease with TOPRIM domain
MSDAAIKHLRENQQQMDMDGIIVGVSRQALEEALDHITTLEAELAELEAENEALREDRERLEWLVNNNSEIRGNWICIHTYLNYLPEFRAAIDEAMGKDD